MAISEHDWKQIEKYAAEITWPPGSQGVCSGASGEEAANFADFTRFAEGTYRGGNDWSQLSPQDAQRFSKWLPKGGRS